LQLGYQEVEEIVKIYEHHFDLVLRIKKQHEITLGNINQNRIIGTSICFDLLDSDVVLGIEEDTKIGYDSLHFIIQMCFHQQVFYRLLTNLFPIFNLILSLTLLFYFHCSKSFFSSFHFLSIIFLSFLFRFQINLDSINYNLQMKNYLLIFEEYLFYCLISQIFCQSLYFLIVKFKKEDFNFL
jgi:hypothetical protein